MIENEKELKVTKEKLSTFKVSLDLLKRNNEGDPILRKAQIDSITSFILEFEKDIKDYIPRRMRMDKWCHAERVIYNAVQTIEEMPADVHLTDAQNILTQARNKVADYIDNL